MIHLPSIYPDTLVLYPKIVLKYNSAQGISCVCVYLVKLKERVLNVALYLAESKLPN